MDFKLLLSGLLDIVKYAVVVAAVIILLFWLLKYLGVAVPAIVILWVWRIFVVLLVVAVGKLLLSLI